MDIYISILSIDKAEFLMQHINLYKILYLFLFLYMISQFFLGFFSNQNFFVII